MRELIFKELCTKISKFTSASDEDIKHVVSVIFSAIDESSDDNYICLNDKLQYLSSGCFKMAYEPLPGVIIKLCGESNSTGCEHDLLRFAERDSLLNYFVPTEFVDISSIGKIFLSDSHADDCIFDFIEIQPKIDRIVGKNSYDNVYSSLELRNHNITVNEYNVNGYKILQSGLYSKDWIKDAIKIYGIDSFNRFLSFCECYDVYDLHCRNIGYLDNKPVILDWLSSITCKED